MSLIDFKTEGGRGALEGRRIAIMGRMGGLSQRETRQLIRECGGVCVDRDDPTMNLLVVGADAIPFMQPGEWDELESRCRELAGRANVEPSLLNDEMRQIVTAGKIEIISETALWERIGLVEEADEIGRLYTPAMLADLVGVKVATIRSWHRRGLIEPIKMVHRLPYFDFEEVTTARRLAELVATGVSAAEIERKLASLAQFVPGVRRPLAQLSVIVEGKQILLREGQGLIEPNGQKRFDFDSLEPSSDDDSTSLPFVGVSADPISTPESLLDLAMELEEEGRLAEAAEVYRAALAAGGPDAEICFQLAETLYRIGSVEAAAERYYMAVELDEDYVEARANLGCVLLELGQLELAAAAFEGALLHHQGYADVHFHLARVLDDLGQAENAEHHWRQFLDLAPASPWAEEARARLEAPLRCSS